MAIDDVDTSLETPILKVSEQEQLTYLRDKATNFIFLFGKQGEGKTAITASLIHYLNTECHYGSLEKKGNPEGQRVWEIIKQAIARGHFPDRTSKANVYEVESLFVPSSNHKHLSKVSLTFLEMSGESLSEVSIMKSGRLPSNIDSYFKVGNLSMTFLLITSHQEAHGDDHLIVEFLDYIIQKSPRFRDARVLLLLSKWDTYTGPENVTEFLKRQMPNTFRRLAKSTNAYGVFSLGEIASQVGGAPRISKYDSRPAKDVFEWLYRTLTGKRIS